ncbi:MAG TPA: biotin/lipoyl-containing protein, partial [Actinomycetes bacterium]|nr:biotin/lipoyl-containing protein [Actinomycetes bacterium]
MSHSVTMPALGESVTEGTVTRWLKQEGEEVAVDEPLLEVSTDKVDTEIPSPAAGVLQKILVGEDETVDVGAELAVIGDGAGDSGGDAGGADQSAGQEQQGQQDQEQQGQEDQEQQDGGGEDGGGQQAEQPGEQPQQSAPPAEQESQQSGDQAGGSGGDGSGGGGGTSVTMPALGESVTEGTVTRWLKQEGDQVETDEPLLEVSTDKVDTEIPSPASGTLTKILVGEDETVAVGAELATIGGGGGGQEQSSQPESQPEQQAPPEQAAQQQSAAAPQPSL